MGQRYNEDEEYVAEHLFSLGSDVLRTNEDARVTSFRVRTLLLRGAIIVKLEGVDYFSFCTEVNICAKLIKTKRSSHASRQLRGLVTRLPTSGE